MCNHTKEEFYDATLPEIIYQIRNYKKFNAPKENNNKYNNQNDNNKITKGETVTYGVDPETLKRWEMEDMALE